MRGIQVAVPGNTLPIEPGLLREPAGPSDRPLTKTSVTTGAGSREGSNVRSTESWLVDGDLVVVIPTQDDGQALEATLSSLAVEFPRPSHIHVIADHCSDDTVEVAESAGVRVHLRSGEAPLGKGHALSWWVERSSKDSHPDQIVVVIDADSRVDQSFFRSIVGRFESGEAVVQAAVVPVLTSGSQISSLAALSEIAEQKVFERVRGLLGWPARLRGTGMAFRREVLTAFAPQLSSISEDAELSVMLAASGIRTRFAPEARVLDPKPADELGATRQRSRWLRGQVQLLQAHPGSIARLIMQGPPGWALMAAIFAKPKSIFLPVQLAVLLSLWSASGRPSSLTAPGTFALLIALLIVASNAAAFGYSIARSQHRRMLARALLSAPLFLLMWLKSLLMALFPKERWPRSRPAPVEQRAREASIAG